MFSSSLWKITVKILKGSHQTKKDYHRSNNTQKLENEKRKLVKLYVLFLLFWQSNIIHFYKFFGTLSNGLKTYVTKLIRLFLVYLCTYYNVLLTHYIDTHIIDYITIIIICTSLLVSLSSLESFVDYVFMIKCLP